MRVGLDATPLLGPRTGVGHYVARLVEALALSGEVAELRLIPFTWRGTSGPAVTPAAPRRESGGPAEQGAPGAVAGVRVGRRRVPARVLRAAWARVGWPPVEWFAGRVDVFHATNFVAPPARRAGLVVTIHDLTYLRYPEMVTAASARYRTLVPAGLARGAIVCTPTAAVAAEVLDTYHLPADRVMVTPLGVGRGWLEAEPPAACHRGTCCSSAAASRARTWARCWPPTASCSRAGRRRHWCWSARPAGARSRTWPACPAAACTPLAISATPSWPGWWPARRRWPTPPGTRASACRRWRRWPAAPRWWPATSPPCGRCSGTRPSWSIPATPARWRPPLTRRSRTAAAPRGRSGAPTPPASPGSAAPAPPSPPIPARWPDDRAHTRRRRGPGARAAGRGGGGAAFRAGAGGDRAVRGCARAALGG